MKKNTYFFLLFSLFIALLSFAQTNNYAFNHLSTSDGLSQSSAIALEQDKLGQIWIGTRDGLNKYDGNKFTTYRNITKDSTSISNNDILSVLEDKEGFIWVGTYNGLNKYNPKKDTFVNYFHSNNKNSLSNNTVWEIKEMFNGDIWIGTSNGLSIYNKKTDSFTNIFNQKNNLKSISGNHILSILQTKDSTVWLGTTKGLSKFISNKDGYYSFKNYEQLNNKTKPLHIQDLIEDKNKNILIATKKSGLLYLNNKNNNITNYLTDLQQQKISKNVRKLIFDTKNALWIGTYNGLNVLKDNGEFINLKSENYNSKSLSKNSIKSILKDKKGTIWVGTYYGGLNIWDSANINFINFSENNNSRKINYNVISSIETYKNLLLFGTEGKGVNIFNKNTNDFKIILPNKNVKSLFVDNNLLWIGTFANGIKIYNLKTNLFEQNKNTKILDNLLGKMGVYSIKKDKSNTFWFGTFGLGVVNYNLKNNSYKTFKQINKNSNSLSNNLVRSITIDSKNNVWVCTQKGLNKITNNKTITHYFYNNNVQSGDDVTTVFEDNNKNIWVGTKAKGLFKLENKSFKNINLIGKKETISIIHSILEDKNNNLWISTNEGIIKLNTKNKKHIIFNEKDGLVSNEFNDNSSLKATTSQFYFGGPNGITSFNTKKISNNTYTPQVLLTDFKIKNKSINIKKDNAILEQTITYTNKIDLSHEEGNFTIQFAIPNFINAKNNSYKYRLKGLEDDWIFTTENTASYTIQNSGNYVFEVKGANNNGVWNKKTTLLKINVGAAPWLSWWAILLYGIVIFTALYFFIAIRQSKSKLKYALDLELLENEKKEENNKAKLEFFTNISHEFRTPLTLILGPLQQILSDYKGSSNMYKKLLIVENSSKHLLQLINRLMDFRKLENNLFKLEAAEGNIVKFLKEIYLSFTEYAKNGDYDFNFHTTEDTILVYYDRYKLERVFYNLISNAFRYTPKNGAINVRIKKENNTIIISVEDTGVGISRENKDKIFDRFFEISPNNNPEKNYNKGTGIGLSIAKNIVKLHKGTIAVQTNQNNIGSVFKVTLPLGKTHLKEDEILRDFKFSDDISQYITQLEEPTVILEDELTDTIQNKEKETILIVEDNTALRKFIKGLLKENYNIIEAENGKVALNMSLKHLPDLIISDVVMPVMVGTELCSKIKENIKTSHIPIILLTSRTSLIYKLDGLESGADDYISKPFNINEFKVRITNLLNTTNRLKEKFSKEDILTPSEVVISSLDEKLYKKAIQIVEINISNSDFDIHFFCSELGVSRTMLFTKIKAWTSFTPNEFIQHFRMKRAAQLLEKGKINISEISYKVGFKNPKYFSKCFQKKYGQTPSQYSNKFSEY